MRNRIASCLALVSLTRKASMQGNWWKFDNWNGIILFLFYKIEHSRESASYNDKLHFHVVVSS